MSNVSVIRPFTKVICGLDETSHGPNMQWIDTDSRFALDKLASIGTYIPPELVQKIAELQDTLPDDKVAFYNRALGSYESYGLNRNGDGFVRSELMRKHATFVSDAHYYRHHKNKDPAASYGKPVASALNEKTDIVDLIIVGDKLACLDEINRLERGESVPTSMGAKVAFDVCTICDHKARNRMEYCDHVKVGALHPYGMNAVLPSGEKCGVLNPDPRFFDLSKVIVGAARESEHLMKVASINFTHMSFDSAPVIHSAVMAEVMGIAEKSAADKDAAHVKEVPSNIEGAVVRDGIVGLNARESDIPGDVIDSAVDRGEIRGLMNNTAAMGIVLKPHEFRRGMERMSGQKIADFDPPSEAEISESEGFASPVFTDDLDDVILESLSGVFQKRSALMPALLNRTLGLVEEKEYEHIKESGQEEPMIRDMYIRYRAELDKTLDKSANLKADFWVSKVAGTHGRLLTNLGRSYIKLAYIQIEKPELRDRLILKMKKVAKMKNSVDNRPRVSVTGSIADEIGEESLDLMAVESLT